jgi:succinate dehydrogenase/fumarate reductase cytochrome b subunit
MRAQGSVLLIHRGSAAVLITFAAVHLANHLAGLRGVEAHLAFMDAARSVYRAPFVEPFLLLAVLVQLLTGLAQLRAGSGRRSDVWSRLQAVSGGYLLFFLANHTLTILAARGWFGLDSNFFLAAAVLTIPPLPLLFAPYYALGVLALFAHIACAVHFRIHGKHGDRIAKSLLVAGVVLAPIIVAVFTGAVHDIHLPPAYRELVAQFL